ncbi:MAG: prephenate dehydrogenase [Anaerolineae bacterium]
MSDVTITIVGAGAVGTSLGLALKTLEDPPRLIAHDKKSEHARQAMKLNAFDKSEWNLINACDRADLIILALPAAEIRPTLEAIAADLKPDAIISDTAQIKAPLDQIARTILPEHAHFVGGNPIVSTPGSGPQHANAGLFKNALYCLTPAPNVAPEAVKLLEDMVRLIGATPFYLDPLEHDGLMSAVNDLPTLLSLALVNSVGESASWPEMRKLAGGLFSRVSAGAAGDPDSLAEILLNNKTNLLRQLDNSAEALRTLRDLIQTGQTETLAQYIDRAVVTRANWQNEFEANTLSSLVPKQQPVQKPNVFKQLFGLGRK